MLDHLFGGPAGWRPWTALGKIAQYLETAVNVEKSSPVVKRTAGLVVVICLLVPAFSITSAIASIPLLGYVGEVFLLYLTLGNRTLIQRTREVLSALNQDKLDEARLEAAKLVSRDTAVLTELGITRATVESVLENGNDAVFAPVFCFLCLGVPGAVAYQIVNLLNVLWDDRESHFADFGWSAARLHDLMNYIPSRVTALTYALAGNFSRAWTCWQNQAPQWSSANTGAIMAAGAGSLGVELGGPAMYHGKMNDARPLLGEGDPPKVTDIERSISLYQRSLAMWLLISVVICLSVWK
jgi:adenosylcobinamide-phosphate synthase